MRPKLYTMWLLFAVGMDARALPSTDLIASDTSLMRYDIDARDPPRDVKCSSRMLGPGRPAYTWVGRRCHQTAIEPGRHVRNDPGHGPQAWYDKCRRNFRSNLDAPGRPPGITFEFWSCTGNTYCKNIVPYGDPPEEHIACIPNPPGGDYHREDPEAIINNFMQATIKQIMEYNQRVQRSKHNRVVSKVDRGVRRVAGGQKQTVEVVLEEDVDLTGVSADLFSFDKNGFSPLRPDGKFTGDTKSADGALGICESHYTSQETALSVFLQGQEPSLGCESTALISAKKGSVFNFHIDLSTVPSTLIVILMFFFITPMQSSTVVP